MKLIQVMKVRGEDLQFLLQQRLNEIFVLNRHSDFVCDVKSRSSREIVAICLLHIIYSSDTEKK